MEGTAQAAVEATEVTRSQLERGQEEVKNRCQQIVGEEQLVAIGCSGETSQRQKQRKVRRPSRKGPRKVGEASFETQGSLSSSTLSVIFTTPPPPPHASEPTAKSPSLSPGKPPIGIAQHCRFQVAPPAWSASCSCESAQWVLLTLYQQLRVSTVLACLAAVGALVLRSDVMDD